MAKYFAIFAAGIFFLAMPAYCYHAEKTIDTSSKKISAAPNSQKQRLNIRCTAYSLLADECGKISTDPGYGITAAGIDLKNKTRDEARIIATDPKFIPLGTKVLLVAKNPKLQRYNGIYTAGDTGGLIKGNRVDIFFGDTHCAKPIEAINFGAQEFFAYIL